MTLPVRPKTGTSRFGPFLEIQCLDVAEAPLMRHLGHHLAPIQGIHLPFLPCLHMKITGAKHHFSPGETRHEGKGPRCQSTKKAKGSTNKANAKNRGEAEAPRTPPTSIFCGLLRRRGGRRPRKSVSRSAGTTGAYFLATSCSALATPRSAVIFIDSKIDTRNA